jgi:hypothetical protein
MASHRVPIGGWQLVPDSSGSAYFEPFSVKATNDVWRHLVLVMDQHTSPTTVYGCFETPRNYSSGGSVIPIWTTTATSGAVEWGFASRVVGGDDIESFDQAGTESVDTNTDTAPSAANERMETQIAFGATTSAASSVEFQFSRRSIGAVAAAITVHGLVFEYEDSA